LAKGSGSEERILLAHGGGGVLTRRLVEEGLMPFIGNPLLAPLGDSAVLPASPESLAFTTDSFVVKPLFFRGGDIGRLAVSGTVNDLLAAGATPEFLSLALIIEEGLLFKDFRRIVRSIADTAEEAGVRIVTGDTKVVERGAADGIFINTSGVGHVPAGVAAGPQRMRPGDRVILTGTIGEHGIAVISERKGIEFDTPVVSDVAPLTGVIGRLLRAESGLDPQALHAMRDPTRGGVAAALNELAHDAGLGIRLWEERIPVLEEVRAACDMLGFDPLAVPNEGKMLVICAAETAEEVLHMICGDERGRSAAVIGEVVAPPARVLLETAVGGSRVVDMPYGEELPRIC